MHWGYPKLYGFNTVAGNSWNSSSYFFSPGHYGEGEKSGKETQISLWFFFFQNLLKVAVLHWEKRLSLRPRPRGTAQKTRLIPLYCINLLFVFIFFLISVMCGVTPTCGEGVSSVSPSSWFQFWVFRHTTNTRRETIRQKEILSLCWASPQHWRVGFVLLLVCSFEEPVDL